MCDCIEKIKKELNISFYVSLAETMSLKTGKLSGYGLRCVQTAKTRTGKEKKRKTYMYINFCPFCGADLREKEE